MGQASIDKQLLGKDEEIVSPEVEEQKRNEVLDTATKYVKILRVVPRLLFPYAPILMRLARRGIILNFLFLDYQKELMTYINRVELDISRKHFLTVSTEEAGRMTKSFMDLFNDQANVEARLYDQYPFWRGEIVDGERATYLMNIVPRFGGECPTIYTENKLLVNHFESHYFDPLWTKARKL